MSFRLPMGVGTIKRTPNPSLAVEEFRFDQSLSFSSCILFRCKEQIFIMVELALKAVVPNKFAGVQGSNSIKASQY